MSYVQFEESQFESNPLELYVFERNGTFWRYANRENGYSNFFTFGNLNYECQPLSRTDINQTADFSKSPITIQTTSSLPFVRQFISSPPSDIVTLSIYSVQLNDPQSEFVLLYSGRVTEIDFTLESSSIQCESNTSLLKRPGLRRTYQRNCPHVLYGSECKVVRSNYSITGTVTEIDGLNLTITELSTRPLDYFTGGFITFNDNGELTKRFIKVQQNTIITINLTIPNLSVNDSITLFAGCNRSVQTCLNKFDNIDNFGGFPYIPTKNPFGAKSTVF